MNYLVVVDDDDRQKHDSIIIHTSRVSCGVLNHKILLLSVCNLKEEQCPLNRNLVSDSRILGFGWLAQR